MYQDTTTPQEYIEASISNVKTTNLANDFRRTQSGTRSNILRRRSQRGHLRSSEVFMDSSPDVLMGVQERL